MKVPRAVELKASTALVVFTQLENQQTTSLGEARKFNAVLNSLESTFNMEALERARAAHQTALTELVSRKKRGEALTDKECAALDNTLIRSQRQFYNALDQDHAAATFHAPVDALEHVLDRLGKLPMDEIGRRALLEFAAAVTGE